MAKSTSSASWLPQNPGESVTLNGRSRTKTAPAAEREPRPIIGRAFDIALKLEGLHRHASTHAAGIVISERPLHELVPLYRDPKSNMPVTQFNMKWVEPAGLVKFDFLGLKTLTCSTPRCGSIRSVTSTSISRRIPLDDAKTTRCWRARKRSGSSRWKVRACGARWSTCVRTAFEDLIVAGGALSAGPDGEHSHLLRPQAWPGSRSNICTPSWSRSWRPPTASSPTRNRCSRSPAISPATASAKRIFYAARWARKTRRRWRPARRFHLRGGRAAHRPLRCRGDLRCLRQVPPSMASNKSQLRAYALLTYQTAYLKANYPVEFLAASMTLDMGNTDKLSEFRAEAERLGVKVEPPSINRFRRRLRGRGQDHSLRARALQGRGSPGRWKQSSRRAPKSRLLTSPILRAASIARRSTSGCWKVLPPPVPSMRRRAIAPRVSPRVDAMLASAQREHEAAESGALQFSFGGSAARRSDPPADDRTLGCRRSGCRRSSMLSASSSRHRSMTTPRTLKRMRCSHGPSSHARCGRGRAPARRGRTVVARTERRTRTGNKMDIGLSDPTGPLRGGVVLEGLRSSAISQQAPPSC